MKNQLVKAIFISSYPIFCLAAVVLSIISLTNGMNLEAIALLLTTVPMLVLLTVLFTQDVARTEPDLKMYTLFVILGMLLPVYNLLTVEASYLAYLAITGGLLWMLYVKWYSIFENRENDLLTVGENLPDFEVEDAEGAKVSSNSFKGKKSILMFYRGNWCPLCMAQIKEIAAQYKELEAKGIQTVLISPQPHGHTRSLARKMGVPFRFLVDKEHAAATKLNIIAKNGLPMGLQTLGYDSDTVMPTIILTDETGKILYTDLTANYRVRPEPAEFLKFFDRVPS